MTAALSTDQKNRDEQKNRDGASFAEVKKGDGGHFPAFLKNLRLLVVADSSTTHTHRWAQWFAARGSDVTVLSHAADPIENVRVVQFPTVKHWYHHIPKLR